jgi:hypothetical protein
MPFPKKINIEELNQVISAISQEFGKWTKKEAKGEKT